MSTAARFTSVMTRTRIVPFFIPHAGCPHRCLFCNQETVAFHRPLEEVAADIGKTLSALPPDQPVECAFYGGTFAALPRQERHMLLKAVHPFRERGTVSGIRISTRPDSVNATVVRELAAGGVDTVELGVQSLNDEVLLLSRRGHSARDAEIACRLLSDHGFSLGIQLMPGLPGDTVERSVETMAGAIALQPDFLRIYPTLVLEGAGLEDLYRQGVYQPLALSEAVALCKRLLLMARRAAIPVIRMGVQSTELLDRPGTVLAGPYHPAFRQLVESALYGDLLLSLLPSGPASCVVNCHPSRVSDLVGQRRANLERAATRGCTVRVVADETCSDDTIVLTAPGCERRTAAVTDLCC